MCTESVRSLRTLIIVSLPVSNVRDIVEKMLHEESGCEKAEYICYARL